MKIVKISKEEFINLFNDKNLTIKEVATKLKVCSKTIYQTAKRLGITRNKK